MKIYLEIRKDKFIVKTHVFFFYFISIFSLLLLNANAKCKQLPNLCCLEFLYYIIEANDKEQLFFAQKLLL